MKALLVFVSFFLLTSYSFAKEKSTPTKETEKIPAVPVQVVVDAAGDAGYVSTLSKCSDFKKETASCFTSYDGEMRGQCEVCREDKSCFISLEGKPRSLCEAYKEKKNCFLALSDKFDRAWCEHFQEKKPCNQAFGLQLAAERGRCERGDIPRDHYFWMN